MEVGKQIYFNYKSHWTLTLGDPFADLREMSPKLIFASRHIVSPLMRELEGLRMPEGKACAQID